MKTTAILTALLLISFSVNSQVVKVSSFSQNFSPPSGSNGPVYKVNYNVDVSIIDGMVGSGLRVSLSPKSITISSYRYEGKEYTSSQIKSPLFTPSSAMGGYSFRIAVSHKGVTVGDGRLSGAGMLTGGSYNISLEKLGYKMPGRDEDPVEAGKKTAAISKALKESVYGIQSSEPQYAGLIASTNASFEKEIKKYLEGQKPKEEPKERVDATIELSVGSGSSSSSDKRDDKREDRRDTDHSDSEEPKTTMTPEQAKAAAKAMAEGKRDADRRSNMNSAQARADINIQSQRKQAEIRSQAVNEMAQTVASLFAETPQQQYEREQRKEHMKRKEEEFKREYERKAHEEFNRAEKLALQGDINSYYALAGNYYYGKGVAKNRTEALKWYWKALNESDKNWGHKPYVKREIARIYIKDGIAISQNSKQTINDWIIEDKNGELCYGIAYDIYLEIDMDLVRDFDEPIAFSAYTEALKYLRLGAERGNISSQAVLAGILYGGYFGRERNINEYQKWAEKASAADPKGEADYKIGCHLAMYWGILSDKSKFSGGRDAKEYYRKKGSFGSGFKKQSEIDAIKWIQKAAEKGNKNAMSDLAYCYERGYLIRKDKTEAEKWLSKSKNSEKALATTFGSGGSNNEVNLRNQEQRTREAEERAEYKAHVTNMKTLLKTDFIDGKLPLSSDNISASELWYFAWRSNSILDQVYVTEIFPIARYGDGSYPFKNAILKEISSAGGTGDVTLVGWYTTKEQAQQALDKFIKTAQEAGVKIQSFTYKGKPETTSTSTTNDDFWGTGQSSKTDNNNNDFWD